MARDIVSTADTCSGEPRIDGTRLTCANVVLGLTVGRMRLEEFFKSHPYLNTDDVAACAGYCASRQCISANVLNYCHGCTLDKRQCESCESPEDIGLSHDEPVDKETFAEDQLNGWEWAQQVLGRVLEAGRQ